MNLSLKKYGKRGPVAYLGSFVGFAHRAPQMQAGNALCDRKGGEEEPGKWRMNFSGNAGHFFMQGGHNDAKDLIARMAEIAYLTGSGAAHKRHLPPRLAQLEVLEQLCEDIRKELNEQEWRG